MSYCLFGILDVPLGANYGEGREKARRRLENALAPPNIKARLNTAGGATYDSWEDRDFPACLEGTRVELLRKINDWTEDPAGEFLFRLSGMAGTGKSTISRTIARKLHERRRLGASFFFKRGGGDRGNMSRFYPTLVLQLADAVPGLASLVAKALDHDSHLGEKNLGHQFEKLLMEPLTVVAENRSSLRLVIVIDALDECDKKEDRNSMLMLLARLGSVRSLGLQIFLTSRPEASIQQSIRKITEHLHLTVVLEEAQATQIAHDIRLYFKHRLEQIREEDSSRQLNQRQQPDWPGIATIDLLSQWATPLFIHASTMCRFISERNPRRRLESLLRRGKEGSSSGLSDMYMLILGNLTDGADDHESSQIIAAFKVVVGSIILLSQPLSARSLSKLLEMPLHDVYEVLDPLRSVLSVPSNHDVPVRTLHASFSDFLLDSKTAGPYSIDEDETHYWTFHMSLQRMSATLKFDICDQIEPGVERADVPRAIVTQHIPEDVAYACCNWFLHVRFGDRYDECVALVNSFLRTHFLHWIEVMSWLDKLRDAILSMDVFLASAPEQASRT